MTNREDNPKERDLDRTLDAALAKYASVEPREGLQERILANVRAAGGRAKQRAWWTWGFAAVLAAAFMIVAAVVWQWNKVSQPPIVVHRPPVNAEPIAPRIANRDIDPAPQKKQHRTLRPRLQPEIASAGPKLDVFPSPLPLSEQEKILASYVAGYPEHAALVAEARMDALRQEAEERRRIAGELDEKQ